ncbi:MAG: hypothetical protein HYV27_15215 [Candidatus Hydrogenedentes bacterium]|nr:hypothetical protein [Candidatus Hydrogenedentota bacterium]
MTDLDLSVYSEDEVRAMRTALGMALAGVPRDRVVESVTAQGVADPEGFVTAAVEHVWQLLGLEGMTREFHVAARWSLYGSARAAGELKICRELLTDLARLQGLYPGQRAVTTPGGGSVESGGKGPGVAVAPGKITSLDEWLNAPVSGQAGGKKKGSSRGPSTGSRKKSATTNGTKVAKGKKG